MLTRCIFIVFYCLFLDLKMSSNQKAEKESEKDVKVKVPPKFQSK